MRARAVLAPAALLLACSACSRGAPAPVKAEPSAATPSTPAKAEPPAPHTDASSPTPARGCSISPKGGAAIPSTARATEVHLATAGGKALVTWYETAKREEGPDLLATYGHAYDEAGGLGPRLEIDTSDVGDEPISGATAVAVGANLFAVSCTYAAPAGAYACARRGPGGRPTTLFEVRGISTGGPIHAGIAAVARGDDALVVVPESGASDVHAFSARVLRQKKTYPFGGGEGEGAPHADGLGATLTAEDEATVVFRHKRAVRARRVGFDQAWRGRTLTVSEGGAEVGAPVVASEGERVVALFSQRARTSAPWRITMAAWSRDAEPKRAELATGEAQAQGPAIAKAREPGCYLVSWVEGSGKTTRTVVARMCDGKLTSATPLSADGVEGGRATLAADRDAAFAVWQELPAGKPVELRIGKLTCD